MTEMPKVIYLHDGQTEVTWSESREVFGQEYVRADCVKMSALDRHKVEEALDYLANTHNRLITDRRIAEAADTIRKFIVEQSQ